MCLLLIVDVLLQSACKIESSSGPAPRGGEGELLDRELLFNVYIFFPS